MLEKQSNFIFCINNYAVKKLKKLFCSKATTTRCMLYISIASLTALIGDISQYQNFSEISSIKLLVIAINVLLQGLIAWRAYIDTSLKDAQDKIALDNKQPANIKLLLEDK